MGGTKRSGIRSERLTIGRYPRKARGVAEQPVARVERERQVFVQQARMRAQHLVRARVGHRRPQLGEREDPEHRQGVVVFLRLSHRRRKSLQRSCHAGCRIGYGGAFAQVYQCDPQVRLMMKVVAWNIAALERSRELDVGQDSHPVYYYDIVVSVFGQIMPVRDGSPTLFAARPF